MKIKLLATLIFWGAIAQAQNSIDLFTLSGRYALPAAYDPPQSKKAQELGALLNMKIPVKFSEKTIWYNNLTYTYAGVSNGLQFAPEIMNPISLNAFILQTGLVQRIDETRAFQLLFVPRFMTDFVNPSGKQFQFGAIGLFEKKFSNKLLMRFGAMYNQEQSGPLLVPLIDINWKINNRWSVTGLFPVFNKINYKVNERVTTGLSFFGLITSYYLTNPAYAGDYMERTSLDFTLFCRWKVYGNWHLEGRVGYAANRTYAQYNADEKIDLRISIIKIGDHRPDPKNLLFTDGAIANLRLVYNLPLE